MSDLPLLEGHAVKRIGYCAVAILGFIAVTAFADPLNILLTNDDGYTAPGLVAMRKALEEAGHKVTVVAPSQDQSGKGTSLFVDRKSKLTLKLDEEKEAWHVNGTPTDAVRAALGIVLKETPDIVISGINFGQNVGPISNSSGTVGAAIWAINEGVPAIAVSAGIDFGEAKAEPPFKSTFTAMERAGKIVADIVARLDVGRTAKAPLLPRGLGLNVNVPAREEIWGPVLTRVGSFHSVRIDLVPDADYAETGNLVVKFIPTTAPDQPNPTSDSEMFSAGFVTITPLARDWTGDEAGFEAVRGVLDLRMPTAQH